MEMHLWQTSAHARGRTIENFRLFAKQLVQTVDSRTTTVNDKNWQSHRDKSWRSDSAKSWRSQVFFTVIHTFYASRVVRSLLEKALRTRKIGVFFKISCVIRCKSFHSAKRRLVCVCVCSPCCSDRVRRTEARLRHWTLGCSPPNMVEWKTRSLTVQGEFFVISGNVQGPRPLVARGS